jgi:hypothetical protein
MGNKNFLSQNVVKTTNSYGYEIVQCYTKFIIQTIAVRPLLRRLDKYLNNMKPKQIKQINWKIITWKKFPTLAFNQERPINSQPSERPRLTATQLVLTHGNTQRASHVNRKYVTTVW